LKDRTGKKGKGQPSRNKEKLEALWRKGCDSGKKIKIIQTYGDKSKTGEDEKNIN